MSRESKVKRNDNQETHTLTAASSEWSDTVVRAPHEVFPFHREVRDRYCYHSHFTGGEAGAGRLLGSAQGHRVSKLQS